MSSNPPFPRLQRGKMITNGLVGCWRFSEGSGLKAYDISGNDNHGTLVGGPTWVGGREGSCLSFDGTDDYVDVGTSTTLAPTSVTLSAWIKTTSTGFTGTANSIIDKNRSVGSAYLFDVGTRGIDGLGAGKLTFEMYTGSAWVGVRSTQTVNDGNWHHVSVTYNGTMAYLYTDGSEVNSANLSIAIPYTSNTQLNIGRYIGNNDAFFNGYLDDVRIYNRALSATEIAQIYSGHG